MKRNIIKMMTAATMALTPIIASSSNVSAKTFNIKSYGAKGHKKDDTAAIQKAVDAASHGGTVIIPKGTWYSKVIYLKGNTTIKLAKGAVMKRLAYKEHPEDAFVIFHPKKKGYSGFKKITITGGTWDGQVHKNNSKSQLKGIEIDHGANLTIKNTTIKNMSGLHMVEANACKNVTIDHVKFMNQYFYTGKNHAGVSTFTPYTCEAVQFDSAIKGAASAYPLDHTVCQNVKITNNSFTNVQSAAGTHHDQKKFWKYMHKNVTISNNKVKNIKGDCFHVDNVKKATVSHNTCLTGGRKFLTFYHSRDVKASYNKNSGFYSAAEMIEGTNATLDHEEYRNLKDAYTKPSKIEVNDFTVFVNDGSSCVINNSIIESTARGPLIVNDTSSLTVNNTQLLSGKYKDTYSILSHSSKPVVVNNTTFNGEVLTLKK